MADIKQTSSWRSWLATLPALGVALLPRVTWPCKLPAYTALISSMGLTFLADTAYLFPLTLCFLAVSVEALGFRAERRRGYGPFALGILASVLLLVGKFAIDSPLIAYIGIGLLLAASGWNAWPRRSTTSVTGAPPEALHQIGSMEQEHRP